MGAIGNIGFFDPDRNIHVYPGMMNDDGGDSGGGVTTMGCAEYLLDFFYDGHPEHFFYSGYNRKGFPPYNIGDDAGIMILEQHGTKIYPSHRT